MAAPAKPKQIVKEGLSEYFLYTIEGTETIPNGWSKRLLSFDVNEVPVVNLYKYEQERYRSSVVRFLSFKNDKEQNWPPRSRAVKVYRSADAMGNLPAGSVHAVHPVELGLTWARFDIVVEHTLEPDGQLPLHQNRISVGTIRSEVTVKNTAISVKGNPLTSRRPTGHRTAN
jgi:hypothetical protein